MNYGEYMRRIQKYKQKIIVSNPATPDCSDYARLKQGLTATVTHASYVSSFVNTANIQIPYVNAANFSNPDANQNTLNQLSLTGQLTTPLGKSSSNSGALTVISGENNADKTASLIYKAQNAAMSNTYGRNNGGYSVISTVIPCQTVPTYNGIYVAALSTFNINTAPKNACASLSPGIQFTNPAENIANQGSNALIRRGYNLPNKLDSIRGPIINSR
jgi:hypothetical protein